MSIEKGAMPRLSELRLLRCSGLRLLPLGIENLAALQVMYLLEMPDEFVRELQRGNRNNVYEEALEKIKHTPNIKHVFQTEGRWETQILS